MELKLYLEDREIILTGEIMPDGEWYHFDFVNIPDFIRRVRTENLKRVYLYHPDVAGRMKVLESIFDVIEGAGGLVLNEKNEILFINRRNVWDLPKGKMEQGESAEETALREVKEECGIESLESVGFLRDTYHIYWESGRRKLKITHWFLMRAESGQNLQPQTFEGIDKVEWLGRHSRELKEGKIYKSIRDLLKTVWNTGD
jgi:8-oxo-dGTP pyrophosphatase MutT (NUDIX family)